MARSCPDCGTELRSEDILGITLDVCPDCAGIWFDDGELLKLKELGDDAIDEVEDDVVPTKSEKGEGAKKMCPDCGTGLEEFSYLYTTTVKLDSCPTCAGTWVQDGELVAMRTALEAARTSPENPHLMRTIRHQLDVVADEAEHQGFLDRHRRIARFLRVLSMRRATL